LGIGFNPEDAIARLRLAMTTMNVVEASPEGIPHRACAMG
jgi:hypothetical protein